MVYGTQTQIMHFERGLSFASMSGDTEHSSTIQVLVEDTAFIDLQDTKALQQEIRFPNGLLQIAGVRFAVARITQGLKDGLFLEPPTYNTFTVPVEAADLPAIQQLLPEKTCTYQIRQGGNLLSSAAISTNPTRRAQTGLQILAPTSRVLCRTYALSDTDYVCVYSWRRVPWVRI